MKNGLEQEDDIKLAAEEISKKISDNNNNNKVAYFVGDVSDEMHNVRNDDYGNWV
jgi:hypothetical protein